MVENGLCILDKIQMVIKYQIWYFIGQYNFDICVKSALEKCVVVKRDIPWGFEFEK